MVIRATDYDTFYYRGWARDLAADAMRYGLEPKQIPYGKDLKAFARKHKLNPQYLYNELQTMSVNEVLNG